MSLCRFFELPSRVFWIVLGLSLLTRLIFAATGIEITADTISYQISTLALIREFNPEYALINSPEHPTFIVPQLLEHSASDFLIERTPGFPALMLLHIGLLHLVYDAITTDTLYRTMVFTHSLLGIGIALMSAELAYRVFQKNTLALGAGLLAGLSPNLIGTEHVVLSETLYTASLLVLLLFASRWPLEEKLSRRGIWFSLGLGLLSGWLMWVKPIALAVIIAMALYLLLNRARHQLPFYLTPVIVMIGLWMGFQYYAHGGFLGYTAGSGMNQLYKVINFMDLEAPRHGDFKAELASFAETVPPENAYMSVNAVHTRHLREEAQRPPGERRPMWQVYLEDDRRARTISLEAIKASPGRYIQTTLQQLPRTLLAPTPWDKNLIYWSPLFLLGLLGIVLKCRKQNMASLSLLIMLVLGLHLFFYAILTWGDPRYRIPLEPLLIPFAVFGASRLYEADRQHHRQIEAMANTGEA